MNQNLTITNKLYVVKYEIKKSVLLHLFDKLAKTEKNIVKEMKTNEEQSREMKLIMKKEKCHISQNHI